MIIKPLKSGRVCLSQSVYLGVVPLNARMTGLLLKAEIRLNCMYGRSITHKEHASSLLYSPVTCGLLRKQRMLTVRIVPRQQQPAWQSVHLSTVQTLTHHYV